MDLKTIKRHILDIFLAKKLCGEAISYHTKNTQCKQLRIKNSGSQNKTEEKKPEIMPSGKLMVGNKLTQRSEEVGKLNKFSNHCMKLFNYKDILEYMSSNI